jgi:hypothetical protein
VKHPLHIDKFDHTTVRWIGEVYLFRFSDLNSFGVGIWTMECCTTQTRLEVPAPFATLFLLHISYPPLEAPPTTSPQLSPHNSKVDWGGLFVSLFRFEQFWGWYLDNGVLHQPQNCSNLKSETNKPPQSTLLLCGDLKSCGVIGEGRRCGEERESRKARELQDASENGRPQ